METKTLVRPAVLAAAARVADGEAAFAMELLKIAATIKAEDGWRPVQFADDCPPCELCGEPFCDLCLEHYADCECVGPHQEDDFDFHPLGLWAKPKEIADE